MSLFLGKRIPRVFIEMEKELQARNILTRNRLEKYF